MLRNQRTSLQELYSHESFLSKLNQELIKSIQDMEDNMALSVRAMLQQQGILGVSHLLPSASLLLVQARPLLATPDPCLKNAVLPFVPTYQPGDFGQPSILELHSKREVVAITPGICAIESYLVLPLSPPLPLKCPQ